MEGLGARLESFLPAGWNVPAPSGAELRALERRFARAVALAWWFPLAVSVFLQSFLGFWTLTDALLVACSLIGTYCALWCIAAMVILGRLFRKELVELERAQARGETPELPGLRRLPVVFCVLFVPYVFLGTRFAHFLMATYRGYEYSVGDHVYAAFGAIPSILISLFPIFFYVNDMLGETLGPRGVRVTTAPLWLKFAVLGLFSPVVIDTVLLIYYEDRTGFIAWETVILWLGLLGFAASGTALAFRSLRRSLEPLKQHALAESPGSRVELKPRSLDEIGLLTRAWGAALSERARVERELRQAQKMEVVGQLTGGIAHDFNNHLTATLASIDLVFLEQPSLPDNAKELLEDARHAALRCASLTQQLLAFSRRQLLRPQTIVLGDMLHSVWGLLGRAVTAEIELRRYVQEDLWPCYVDPAQLETALLNLAINARDAMPDGGVLTIELYNATISHPAPEGASRMHQPPPGNYVALAVTDTGTGISPGQLEKVFEPFFTTKDVGRGSGLGLSMVEGFVRQSQGHITIESELGKGTCVRLYLPRSVVSARRTRTTDTHGNNELSSCPTGQGERILVVEDEPQVRDALLNVLDNLGYSADGVGSGRDAIAACQNGNPYDLLLTDVILPEGINGPELARELGARFPALPVVFMSGYTGDALPDTLEESAAALRLLTKPVRLEQVATAVREALDGAASQTTPPGLTKSHPLS